MSNHYGFSEHASGNPRNYLVNTKVHSTFDVHFQLRDDFQESVEMSTYLVAFVVCDYRSIRKLTARNVSVAVYAPPDLLPQAEFALNTATAMMDHYERFFNVDYPLPKQGEKSREQQDDSFSDKTI